MKFITLQTREIGFVHEDSFETFLKKNNVDYKKIENVEVYDFGIYGGNIYTLYKYTKRDNQSVLACSTFVNIIDEFFEEVILFYLEDDEIYSIEQIKEEIREVNKRKECD